MADLAPASCAVDPGADRCPHDRIEPMWDLSLREETGMPGPFALHTGAYTDAELRDLTPDALAGLIDHLAAQVEYHGDCIEAQTRGDANVCERLHLSLYEQDLAVLRALQPRKAPR